MTARPHGVVHIGQLAGYFLADTAEEWAAAVTADWERSGYAVTPCPDDGGEHVFNAPCPVCKPPALAPDVVSLSDIAVMAGVSRQRASQLMDSRTNPGAPAAAHTSAGAIWSRPAVAAYLVDDLGREKTWED